MNKAGVIDLIASLNNITKDEAGKQLNNVLEAFGEAISRNEDVTLVGDLTIKIIHAEETYRNDPSDIPSAKSEGRPVKKILIPAHKKIRIKAGKTLLSKLQ